jgi:glyoxylase-like metal-dependent hydrolase (beta-lactamase superfamily II)
MATFYPLPLASEFMGNPSTIYPAALVEDGKVTLVDTGFPGQLELIRAELTKLGLSLDQIKRIILTHQDIDHIGNLPALVQATGARVYAHAADVPYIEGQLPPLKFNPAAWESRLANLPPEARASMQSMLSKPPSAHVDELLEDGQHLPFAGATVIATPGHTPGHISLLLDSGTLIAGDALVVEGGQLLGPREQATPDMKSGRASVAKLAGFEKIERVLCYHGGLFGPGAHQRLQVIAQQS